MSLEAISDSEDEKELFQETDFSQAKLETILKQKCLQNDINVTETGTLSSDLTRLILKKRDDALAVTFEPNASEKNSPEAMQLVRPTRRRAVFKSVYTIDAVQYILSINREDAELMVARNPRLVEYFRNGTLKKFLLGTRTNTSAPVESQSQSKDDTYLSDDIEPQIGVEMDEDDSDFFYKEPEPRRISAQDDEEDTDDEVIISAKGLKRKRALSFGQDLEQNEDTIEHSDVQETSESDTRSDYEEHDEAGGFKFRGRFLNMNKASLSRRSGLPASFYKLASNTQQRIESKKPRIFENRVGLAKKKIVSLSRHSLFSDPSSFVNDQEELNAETSIPLPFAEGNMDDLSVIDDDKSLPDNSPAVQHLGSLQTGFLQSKDTLSYKPMLNLYDSDSDVEEVREEIDPMLSSKSRRRINSTKRRLPRPRRKRYFSRDIQPKPFRRSVMGSAKSSSPLDTKPVLNSIRSANDPMKQSLGARQQHERPKPQHKTNNFMNRDDRMDSALTTITSRTEPNVRKMKKKIPFHTLAPPSNFILPRRSAFGTTIVESLGLKYAIVPKKSTTPTTFRVNDETPNTELPQIDLTYAPIAFKSHFVGSRAYKRLFTDERIEPMDSYKIKLGSHEIFFSKFNIGFEENFKRVFDVLKGASVKKMNYTGLVDSLIEVIEMSSFVEPSLISSMITTVDNFRFEMDIDIKRNDRISEVQFFFMSFSSMMYFCCHKVLSSNGLKLPNMDIKVNDIMRSFFQFLKNINPLLVMKKYIMRESIKWLFLINKDQSWSAIRDSGVDSLEVVKELLTFAEPHENRCIFNIVVNILRNHLDDVNWSVHFKADVIEIDELFTQFGLNASDELLVELFQGFKKNRFANFGFESDHEVVYSWDRAVSPNTTLKRFLNLLFRFSKDTDPPRRLLEKLVPLSKTDDLSFQQFINRINIILLLSRIFHKDLNLKFSELLQSFKFQNDYQLDCGLIIIERFISSNQRFGINLGFFENFIESSISLRNFLAYRSLIMNLQFDSLHEKTRKSLIVVLSKFKSHVQVIKPSLALIRAFISSDRDSLLFFKENFGTVNFNLFPELWCMVSGRLVSYNMDNWSRLMHYQTDFEDKVYAYQFILRHSGLKIYQAERILFVTLLVKSVVERKKSPSLNLFIKEMEKIDPILVSSKNQWIQINQLQIVKGIVSNLLKSFYSKYDMVNWISLILETIERDLSIRDDSYALFAKKLVEFIVSNALRYASDSSTLERLCSRFEITMKGASEDGKVANLDGDINESLRYLESKLIHSPESFNKFVCPLLLNQNPGKIAVSTTDSRLYPICCLLSIHINLLNTLSLDYIWIYIRAITHTIEEVLSSDVNLDGIDLYCIFKVVGNFEFMLCRRNTSRLDYELMTLTDIYKILRRLYLLVSGTNEQCLFLEIIEPFLSRNLLTEGFASQRESRYFMDIPEFIRSMVVHANLNNDTQGHNYKEIRANLEREFNTLSVTLNDSNDEDFELY